MDERKKLPRLNARREELQYRIHGNNRQIEWMRAPGSTAQDKEQAIGNLLMENALYQAEIEEIELVTGGTYNEWSNRAYMVLLTVAIIVAFLALYGVARAL